MKKILFLTNIPSPYRVDFFNVLGTKSDLTVLYERHTAKSRDLKWSTGTERNFKEIFMKGIKLGDDIAVCPSVLKYITSKYDVVIFDGYSSPTAMLAIISLYIRKIKFIISADGGFIKEETTFKKKFKSFFIRKASAWLSSSDDTTNYLIFYGAKKDKIYKYPFTSILKKDISGITDKNEIIKLKKKLNIKEDKVVLTVGRFIPVKGYDILLTACNGLPEDIGVYIIGGTPTQEYVELKEKYNLKQVHFIDFKPKEQLKQYYKTANVFVLPTRGDVWGLVINEAMSFGLPIVTTDKCVAGVELIENWKNGFLINVDDSEMLREKILTILSDEQLQYQMSIENVKQIENYTIEKMAERHLEIFNNMEL